MTYSILVVASVAVLAGVKLTRVASNKVLDRICTTSLVASPYIHSVCTSAPAHAATQTAATTAYAFAHGHVRLLTMLMGLALMSFFVLKHRPKTAIKRDPAKLAPWQRRLGELMESPWLSLIVAALIVLDISCTIFHAVAETPAFEGRAIFHESNVELAEKLGFRCLCFFLTEQLLNLAASGKLFFGNSWHVADLGVVLVSMYSELNEAAILHYHHGRLLRVMRSWKVMASLFDTRLAFHEVSEYKEKMEDAEKGGKKE